MPSDLACSRFSFWWPFRGEEGADFGLAEGGGRSSLGGSQKIGGPSADVHNGLLLVFLSLAFCKLGTGNRRLPAIGVQLTLK